MREHIVNKALSCALICAFLAVPLVGFGQEVERVAVNGVARDAAASAGCRVHGCVTQNTIAGAAVIAAGTGAVIAMASEVMGISAGVAALGLMGFAGAGAMKDANSTPKGVYYTPAKPLEAGIADQPSNSER